MLNADPKKLIDLMDMLFSRMYYFEIKVVLNFEHLLLFSLNLND